MFRNKAKFLTSILGLVSAINIGHAGSFQAASQHLDTDGSLIAYINFDGDGQEISTKLNSIYQKLLAGGGEIPPIPVDFDLLFQNLGFGSIQGIGLSSKQLSPELYVNRYAVETNGGPTGLFSIYGPSSLEPQAFTAAALVPADATIAGCGPVDLTQLVEAVRTIMIQFMGPMGAGMADQYLTMPIPNTEVTANDLISGLSGRWDYAYKMDISDMESPEVEFWLQVSGGGDIVDKLKSLSEDMPITLTEADNGETVVDLSEMIGEDAPFKLFIKKTTTGDLVVYSNPNWGGSSEGLTLQDEPKFKQMMSHLPEQAVWFTYSAGMDLLSSIQEPLQDNKEVAPYLAGIMEAAEFIVGDFYKPSVAAAYYDGDMLISEQYAGYSTKQVIMLVPTMFAVYPAIAFTGFQKVRANSHEKAVTNNLRQIASAADQYFLEEGKNSVRIEDLVGPDKYIRALNPVAGESYEGMVIEAGTDISVTLGNGEVISVAF